MKSKALLGHPTRARLIPSFKQPERKLLSVFMAVLDLCPELRGLLLSDVGFRSGKTCQYSSYMEPNFDHPNTPSGRPDGLICCTRGSSHWSALVEAKRDDFQVSSEQIQKYLDLAKFLECDAVISISNEFTASVNETPYTIASNKTRGKDIYHWSWPYLVGKLNQFVEDQNSSEHEKLIVQEALAFFNEKKSGVQTFDQMPTSWPDFVQSANTNLGFGSQTAGLADIIYAWHQERRDLAIKLSNQTGTQATVKLARKQKSDASMRVKEDRILLAEHYKIEVDYEFKGFSGRLKVIADLRGCLIQCRYVFKGPEDKKSKATMTWLAKTLALTNFSDVQIRAKWPGQNKDTFATKEEFLAFPEILVNDPKIAPTSLAIITSRQDTRRFKSRKGFIEDLEKDALSLAKQAQEIGIF